MELSPNLGDVGKDENKACSQEKEQETNRTSVDREQLNLQEQPNLQDREQLKWDDIKQKSSNENLDDSSRGKFDFHDQSKSIDNGDVLTEKPINKCSSVDISKLTVPVENQEGVGFNPEIDKVISEGVATPQQCCIGVDKQTGCHGNDPVTQAEDIQQEVTHFQRNIEERNKVGSNAGGKLILPEKDNGYIPSSDDNNSCSVGFDYCENSESEWVKTTNFSSISQIESHKTFHLQTYSDTTSKGGINPDNEITQSCSKSDSLSSSLIDEQRLCNEKGDDSSTKDENCQCDVNIDKSCDKTVQIVHSPNKRKSPSLQARRLKLDALVENIKSLKASELKEPLIKADLKETNSSDITFKVHTLNGKLGNELSISNFDVKSECEPNSVKASGASDTSVKLEESASYRQNNDSNLSLVLVKQEFELNSENKLSNDSVTSLKVEEGIELNSVFASNDLDICSSLKVEKFSESSSEISNNDSDTSLKVEESSESSSEKICKDSKTCLKEEQSFVSSSVKVRNDSDTCLKVEESSKSSSEILHTCLKVEKRYETSSEILQNDLDICLKVDKSSESSSEILYNNSETCLKVEENTESNSVSASNNLNSRVKVEENVYSTKCESENNGNFKISSSVSDEVKDLNTDGSVDDKDNLDNENTLQFSKHFEGVKDCNEQKVVSSNVEVRNKDIADQGHSVNVENIEDEDTTSCPNKNNNSENDTEVKSDVFQEVKKETLEQSKSQFLKPPIFHFDSQSKKKIYELSDVFGNKQPVVYLGERVSKEKTLAIDQSETSRLTKLANVKTKKPVKKIEMIRHPSRRVKRVASLNALAMVNILFGKDDSPPKIHKSEKIVNKKVVSSKSLSKAKLILEEKVKCLLKKAKAIKELNQSEDAGQSKVKKEKTTPKKISQIEKSLAKLSLNSPPAKGQSVTKSQNSTSPEKSQKKASSLTKSPTKVSPSTKSVTKTSESKKFPTKSSKTSKISKKTTANSSKIIDKEKKNRNAEIKKKKENVEKNTKGEKSKKCGDKVKKEEKNSKKKNSESDVNKNNAPKQRRKRGELLRSARTHSFHEVKIKKSDNVENSKEQSTQPCVNCQHKTTWKNDGDKNNFVDGSVQYNVGHVDSGTYSTHSYGVVPSMSGPCVHCSPNGGLYSSQGHLGQGSSFISGIMGQPGGIPCQTFTIGSVPMVQYHHPFGTGYPIQYQSHSALPHCGCPSCYYYTPTASPLPHHDTCHHSVPPTYAPVRDDTSGIHSSYGTAHSEGDFEIDVIGGVSPLHISDHHLPSSMGKSVEEIEIDVVGGVSPLTFSNDKDIMPSPKKKKKTDSESETKKKSDKKVKANKENTKILKSDKENKEKQVKKKKNIDEKQKEKEVKKKPEPKKEAKDKSKESTQNLKVTKKKSHDDVKVKKAKTLSELAEELKAMKKKNSSKSTEESKVVKKKEDSNSSEGTKVTKSSSSKASENLKPDTVRKRSLSKSPDDQDKTIKKRKVSKSVDEPVLDRKKLTGVKRKSSDSVFNSDVKPTSSKQNKTGKTKTTNTLINRSKSVDAKVLKEIEVSKTYPKRKRVTSLTRQFSAESEIVSRRKSSSSKPSSSDKTVKKKVEAKKPKKKNHDWEFISPPEKKKIMVRGSQVERECYPAIRHTDGDMIYVRDVVILRSGPRKTDIPYLGKVTAFWEEYDEMMMGLLWYYHPEHTDTGRQTHHLQVEIFASKHRDENSIACIDDKGYVLTYNEYCRYRAEKCRTESSLPPRPMVVPVLEDSPRAQRIPPPDVDTNTVYMCRQVYDFKSKRILKNPS